MKSLFMIFALAIAVGMSSAWGQNAQENPPSLTQAVDILVGALNGAQAVMAEQNHTAVQPISDAEIHQLKQNAQQISQTLNTISRQLEAKDILGLANTLDSVQNQLSKGNYSNDIQLGDILRTGDAIYQRWQRSHPQADFNHLNANEVQSLMQSAEAELVQRPQTRQLGQMLGGFYRLLAGFNQIANAPEPYQLQQQQLSHEVAQLKALAAQQGITAPVDAQTLITGLKLSAAEHIIGEKSVARDAQLKQQLNTILSHPYAIFSIQDYQAIDKLLLQLGSDFFVYRQKWQQQKSALIR
ncbi:hypothetical protein [Suttonella ornithocola]|uniref:P-type conjugative transfer protein TrbJ n=1 Tax=Suttonella ornithocola TaxID=279832 RepID=A0A380MUY3_9GAMM|nr:hypothetical protein [Suttonella ornithocola]SUO95521.1 Uncharacterised protein [Suttonella ornithocola]